MFDELLILSVFIATVFSTIKMLRSKESSTVQKAFYDNVPPNTSVLSSHPDPLQIKTDELARAAAIARIAYLEEKKRAWQDQRAARFAELHAIVRRKDIPTSYNVWPYEAPTAEQVAAWNADPDAAAYSKNVVELVEMMEENKQEEAYCDKIIVETGRGIDYIPELDHATLRTIMCEEMWRAEEYKHRMAPIGKEVTVLNTPFRGYPDHGAIYWMIREDTPQRWRRMKYMY